MAQQRNQPDICVIGAGAGGLAAAAAAAAMGVSVVLIAKGPLGGQSLYGGSVPTKALLAAAEHVTALHGSARFGVKSVRSAIDFAAVRAHVRQAVEAVAPQASSERFTGLGVRVITGAARFKDAGTVGVDDTAIKARRFIIATGSSPLIPPIPGLHETPYLTPETVYDLTDCPRHLIVIGAGRIGLELAQAFRRLGSDVTVLEARTPLAHEDRESAAVVLDALAREGIKLLSGVQIAKVRRVPARIQVVIARAEGGVAGGEEAIEGTHLLIAAGRRPNVEDLELEVAGIRYQPNGIVVDKRLRTTNQRVYAIGDVIDGPKFAHVATHHAGLVVRDALFRHRAAIDDRTVSWVTYTDPELAHVGLLEDAARARYRAIRILRWPYRENDRAATTGATDGHIKVITDAAGEILGVSIVGAAACENITAWALAIGQNLNIGAFAGLIVPYPTYAEVGKRAAITYYMRSLTAGRVRRIMRRLRRLG